MESMGKVSNVFVLLKTKYPLSDTKMTKNFSEQLKSLQFVFFFLNLM